MEETFFPDKPSTFRKWIANFEIVYENRWEDMNFPKPIKDQLAISTPEGQKYLYKRFLEALGPKGRDFINARVIKKWMMLTKKIMKRLKYILWRIASPK